MVNILKIDRVHKQIMATAQRLRPEEDNDWQNFIAVALKKRKFFLEKIFDFYEPPKLSTTEESPETSNTS